MSSSMIQLSQRILAKSKRNVLESVVIPIGKVIIVVMHKITTVDVNGMEVITITSISHANVA